MKFNVDNPYLQIWGKTSTNKNVVRSYNFEFPKEIHFVIPAQHVLVKGLNN